jgi:hypothetical protein
MDLTSDQLATLRHMLGIDTRREKDPDPYRNYAATNPGDSHYLELARLGMIKMHREHSEQNDYDWYHVTSRGMVQAFKSFYARRYPKSKRKYHVFCSIRDSYPDLTFHDFLTLPEFADARKNA